MALHRLQRKSFTEVLQKVGKVEGRNSHIRTSEPHEYDVAIVLKKGKENSELAQKFFSELKVHHFDWITEQYLDGKVFVMVRLPFQMMALRAEHLDMTKVTLSGQVEPFALQTLHLFWKSEESKVGRNVYPPRSFFTSGERARTVYSTLDDIIGILYEDDLFSDIIETVYTVNDEFELKALKKTWLSSLVKRQPIEAIRDYLGEEIAFYFAYLGHYTSWLTIATLMGFIYSVGEYQGYWEKDGLAPCIYAFFIMLWAQGLTEFWKRKQNILSFKWQMTDRELLQQTLSNFDPNTPEWVRQFRQCVAILCTIAMMAVVVFDAALCELWIVNNAEISAAVGKKLYIQDKVALKYLILLFKFLPLIVYVVSLVILGKIWNFVAVQITTWQAFRTKEEAEHSLTLKLVTFQFFNNFFYLFWIAFYYRDADKLRHSLITLLVVKQFALNIVEAGMPFVTDVYKRLSSKEKLRNHFNAESESNGMKKRHPEAKPFFEQYEMAETAALFSDYLEIFVQFGSVTLFISIFPLAPLFAFLNNVIEIRTDSYRILLASRRGRPRLASGIGEWQIVFQMMTYLAVFSNCCLLGVTLEKSGFALVQFFLPYERHYKKWLVFAVLVVVEHVIFALKMVLDVVIDDEPTVMATYLHEKRLERFEIAKRSQIRKQEYFVAVHGSGGDIKQAVLDGKSMDIVREQALDWLEDQITARDIQARRVADMAEKAFARMNRKNEELQKEVTALRKRLIERTKQE
eukprot:g1491.t1